MHFDLRLIKHLKDKLDKNLIQNICNLAKISPNTQATVGKIINGKYTTSYDKWCTANFVDYSSFEDEIKILEAECIKIVQENFKVTCLQSEIHFLSYQNGASYKSHIDGQYIENNIAKRGVDRDITCVIYLNDDYLGGSIKFDFFDLKVAPKQGDMLIYPTTYPYTHGVEAVEGNRIAIVFWFKTNPPINIDMSINDNYVLKYLQSVIE